ncbi:MAG: DUF6491 family protein [Gammaproteobacteria bacterium]|nr:hypothetical protein [Pseudomonadales bacterium]MCP5348879.1 hypothetical protein [Pseudomonadales bacterium]
MKPMILLATLTLTMILAGCAGDYERPDIRERLLGMGLEMGESDVNIPRYRVNGWNSIDDYNLIITAGVNDRYLVELGTPCQGLRSAFYVGFTTPDFGLGRFDNILVRGMDRRPERCPITNITRLYPIDE